jgi:putative ABC transport system substrate-binding protein
VFTPRSVDSILLLTLRDGIPFVGLSPSFVKAGALLSFSCDYADVGAQSAEQALEILGGKSTGDLPIVFPRKVSLYLNLNTARAINLEVSQKIQSESQVEFQR